MCGIAGIIKLDRHERVNEGRLCAMRDSLYHRGPDEAGLHIDGPVGLAHRRLSIIDLGYGQQPMANSERNTWITYNGEVYNYRELRETLKARGCIFATQSDTEVVLQAYQVFGEDCVEHLQGMFAFAIWDGVKQRLFLARDRLGIKPLYYSITASEFLFGSEIKAILAANPSRPSFNRSILPEFLANRYVASGETFFKGVRKLLPGHTMSWNSAEGFRQRHYWKPPLQQGHDDLTRQDYTALVRTGLEEAVRSHLVSDVPVGLFLSGGLDSSALGALMATQVNGPIKTFSVGFSEAAANELSYARLAAESIAAEHREILVTPEQFFAALPFLIWHEDEPIAFTSSVPLHLLSRLARDHVKVVLTGEGADELFLGYDYRYRVTALNKRFAELYQAVLPDRLRKAVSGLISDLPVSMRRYAERSFLALEASPRDLFCENFSLFRSQQRKALVADPELLAACDPHAEILRHYHAAGNDALQCMSQADLQTYLVELLMKQDQMSMSASIESRVPYLDHRLVETVAAIPARFKLRGWQTKALLRDAVRDLVPAPIMHRKKMGFPVPVSSWLRGPFWPLVEDFVLGRRALGRRLFNTEELQRIAEEHRTGKADHGDRLWLLINLEIWHRIFIDQEAPAAIYSDNQQRVRDVMKDSYHPAFVPIH